MKRVNRHSVYPTYLQGAEGVFLPSFKCAVAPGESMTSITAKFRVMSASMSALVMNTAFIEMEFYYVPLRLLWADFPDWIMGTNADASGLTFPTIGHSVDNDILGEHNSTANKANHSAMPLRAAKLIYNEYYLNEVETSGGPLDITADTSQLYWYGTNGFGGVERTIKPSADVDEETFTISVDSGTHAGSISINDLMKSIREQKRKKNVESSGDLYIDMLRSMGVSAASNVIQRPEHLGGLRKYFKPKVMRQADTNVGVGTAYYEGDFSLRIGGKTRKKHKFFPEHGIVMGIMRVMPQAYLKDKRVSLDTFMTSREDFFHPALARDRGFERQSSDTWLGTAASEVAISPWSHYHAGEEFTNIDLMDLDTKTFVRTHEPSLVGDLVQPLYSDFEDAYRTGELADDTATKTPWSMNGVIRYSGMTPVPKGKAGL